MKKYNLSGSQNFYGQKDVKTYYNVSRNKLKNTCVYMAEHFNLPVVFIYEVTGRKKANYVGSYSAKYKNFRGSDGTIL